MNTLSPTPLPKNTGEGLFARLKGNGLFFRQVGLDLFEDEFEVVQDFVVAKTKNGIACGAKKFFPNGIVSSSIRGVMDTSVKFNDQISTSTIKIHNITIKCLLAQKTHTQTRATQRLPQNILSRSRILTHLTLQFQQIRFSRHIRIIKQKPLSIRLASSPPFSRLREKGKPLLIKSPLSRSERGLGESGRYT